MPFLAENQPAARGMATVGAMRGMVLLLLLAACAPDPQAGWQTLRLEYHLEHEGRQIRSTTLIRREPFAYREEVPGAGARISDGRLCWNDRGEPLTGNQARNFLVRAFVEGRRYLAEVPVVPTTARPPLPLPPLLQPDGFPRDGEAASVDCKSHAGITLRLWFDPHDRRLLGYQEPDLDREAWTRYADWQRHGPLLLPHRRMAGWHNPERRQTARLLAVAVDPVLDDALFGGHPLARAPAVLDGGRLRVAAGSLPGVAWLLLDGLLVDGRPVGPAVVDTGASTCVLQPGLAEALRLPTGGAFAAATFAGGIAGMDCWIDHLAWGQARMFQVTAATASFGGMPELLRERWPQVILGGDELLGAPVFDLRAGRLWQRQRPVLPLRQMAGAGQVVEVPARRLRAHSPCLSVTVRVNGVALQALVDTGFAGTLFLTAGGARRAAVPLDQPGPGAFWQGTAGLGGGQRMDLTLRLPGFELGPLRYPAVYAQVEAAAAPGVSRSYEALVGAGALLPFAMVGLDSDRQVLELALPAGLAVGPDGTVPVPSAGASAGLWLRATSAGGPAVVQEVQPGSAADRAGLRRGDRVVGVGARLVGSEDLASVLRELWLRPGAEVALHVLPAERQEPRRVVLRP